MKRTTLYLALAFALIFSYVWFAERKRPPAKGPGAQETIKILDITAPDILAVEIRKNGQSIHLERWGPTSWVIKSPISRLGTVPNRLIDWADIDQCNNLAEEVARLTSLASISKKEHVTAYGLGKEATIFKVIPKSGSPQEMRIGNMDPTRSGVYAYLPLEGKIVLLPASFGQILITPLESWRDHALIHFEKEKITKIEIRKKMPGKDVTLRFVKSADAWELQSPLKEKVDSEKITQFLNALTFARLSSFAGTNEKVSLVPTSLGISFLETGNQPPKALNFGTKTAQGYPAQTSGRSPMFFVPPNVVSAIHTDPAWYKKLHK